MEDPEGGEEDENESEDGDDGGDGGERIDETVEAIARAVNDGVEWVVGMFRW